MGMMQIKLATARGMGYTGTAQGLLDPDTNLTYAVKYLAGAYRAAGGNESRAVGYYAGGYYHAAKRQGLTQETPRRRAVPTAANPFSALALDLTPRRLTYAERRAQRRAGRVPATSNDQLAH
jgi:soluble lytic murein transglycosylase-like protein